MIEFGDRPRRWKTGSTIADAANRKHALAWLRSLGASGGTEMTAGILEALSTLRPDAQRQVVLVTDGQIGYEQEVLSQICARLPAHSRLHVVGVGSAVNRSLTRPAARAGGGVEVVVGIDEDAERAAARIVRRTARPLVTDLHIEGSALVEHAPQRGADLFAGAPAFVSLQLRAEGGEPRGSWAARDGRLRRSPGRASDHRWCFAGGRRAVRTRARRRPRARVGCRRRTRRAGRRDRATRPRLPDRYAAHVLRRRERSRRRRPHSAGARRGHAAHAPTRHVGGRAWPAPTDWRRPSVLPRPLPCLRCGRCGKSCRIPAAATSMEERTDDASVDELSDTFHDRAAEDRRSARPSSTRGPCIRPSRPTERAAAGEKALCTLGARSIAAFSTRPPAVLHARARGDLRRRRIRPSGSSSARSCGLSPRRCARSTSRSPPHYAGRSRRRSVCACETARLRASW